MRIIATEVTDLRSPNFHRTCAWDGCTNEKIHPRLPPLRRYKGQNVKKSHFGPTRVGQIVTATQRHL